MDLFMSVGVWKPGENAESKVVGPALLGRFFQLSKAPLGVLDAGMLDTAEVANENWVMRVGPAAWKGAWALDSDAVISLVRLFTLLEEQVSGWEAGDKSPVISLVKVLKKRGDFEADLRKWIKSNSKNRYLPYGSAM
jgi:hypothetical protein